jgi:hypothetical protein
MAEVDIQTATIATGQSLSTQVNIGNKSLVGLAIPSGWVAAAGGITFQMSPDGGATWYEVSTAAGLAYTIAYTAGGAAIIAIDPTILRGISSCKIRSGTVGAPVVQTAAGGVILQLVTRLVV